MMYTIARHLLADLNHAGAVVGPDGQIVDANKAFKGFFYAPSEDGDLAPSPDLSVALRAIDKSGADIGTDRNAMFQYQNRSFRMDVYYLNNSSGKDGLRLIIATPVDDSAAPPYPKTGPDPNATQKLGPVFAALIGRDQSFVQALRMAQRAAQTDLPVLILGESGTGKEILARTIHRASRRRKRAFVDVNCAAIPDSLVESELFGYEKGAFTGASPSGKSGFFESAHQGSIFMDEIGDAAPQTQAKLLRVLESGQYKRVGGNHNIRVDVRLIAATNQELSQRIADGQFRADLLYRINTITIKLSPLRQRLGDLPLLVAHFLSLADQSQKGKLQFSQEAMDMLYTYAWPGNVRELKGVVDYAVTMTEGVVLTPRSLPRFMGRPTVMDAPNVEAPPGTSPAEPQTDLLAPVVEQAEKKQIQRVLQKSKTRSEAIQRLGISRRTFYAKIKQYGLG